MQKLNFNIIVILFLVCISINLNAQRLDHVLGEVIVEVKNDRGLRELMKDLSSLNLSNSTLEAKQILSEPMNLWVVKTDPNQINEIQLLERITMHPEVLLAQKNHITQLRTIPDDPLFNNQWQYINTGQNGGVIGADIDMDLAWDIATGGLTTEGDTIVACVIDEGFNGEHPDFGQNLWVNNQEIPDNEIDDDGNGYIDDFLGWNARDNNNSDNVYIGGSHGTPVAGIVGAKGNNGIGVSGVNWDVKLMLVIGGGPESTALAAYAYPYTMRKLYNETNGEKGAFVVCTNASWGVDFASPEDAPIWCEFYNLLGEVGILNFGATINGNYNIDEVGDLPTACESNFLVTVTNLNKEDEKITGAGYGERSIDLGAYGEQTYTLTSGAYGGFGGTSGATPHVAGTAALLYSANCPEFIALSKSNPSQAALVAKDCILFGVEPNQSLEGITTTEGRLNANNALENLMSICGDCNAAYGGEVGALTDQSGIVTWYDNGNTGNTSIRYRALGEMEWIEIDDVTSGYQFIGLTGCTPYEFQTKTICDSISNPKYSYPKIFYTEGCCNSPSGINIQFTDQMAIIQWDDVFAANSYVIEWKNVADEVWMSEDVSGDNIFIIDGILECEFYEFRIKSQCSTSNESDYSGIYKIDNECEACTQEYCSFTSKDIGDEWIESVEIVDVFTNLSGVSENGYETFFGKFNIELNRNKEYSIILTPEHSGELYTEYFSAFIDFDQDGFFGNNENIFNSEQGTTESVMGAFTVPNEAVEGITRMRVVMRFGEINGPCDDFGFSYGEIEDYCVTIAASLDCPTQFSAVVTDTTLNSLTFELLESDIVDSSLLIFREKGMQDFDTITSPDNTILISDLINCTLYEYKSGYICQGETLIDSSIFEISTKCDVGVAEIDPLDLNIYPNPSFGNITIDFNRPAFSSATLDLLSFDGKSYALDTKIKKGDTSISVETQSIPSGVYILRMNFDSQIIIKKWIKY